MICIPVLLHMLLKSDPKRITFPALKLLQKSRKDLSRRMQLKHFWVLLLRVLAIALLVFAVARPSLPAANYWPTWWEGLGLILTAFGGMAFFQWLKHKWINRGNAVQQRTRATYSHSMTAGFTGLLCLLLFLLPYGLRVQGEIRGGQTSFSESAPVAAVMLLDSSISMGYIHQNQTRLEQARQLAQEHIETLPRGSRVALGTNRPEEQLLFQANTAAAINRLSSDELLPLVDWTEPWEEALRQALETQKADRRERMEAEGTAEDRYIREIYLLTDLSRSAWKTQPEADILQQLAELDWLNFYLIDVGVEAPQNVGLASAKPRQETLIQGESLELNCSLRAFPGAGEVIVELWAENSQGEMVIREKQRVTIPDDPDAEISTTLRMQADRTGLLNGEVRLSQPDPLKHDNRIPWTVEVISPPKVLVIANRNEAAFLWSEALAPKPLVDQGRARFQVESSLKIDSLLNQASNYDAICLINVPQVSESQWSQLQQFVHKGGGLFLSLGTTRIEAEDYRTEPARDVLPAYPALYSQFDPPQTLSFPNELHPLTKQLDASLALTELSGTNVRRYWKVDLAEQAAVISHYSDDQNSPLLIERRIGLGRVVLMTTAIDLEGAQRGRHWNDMALTGWPFLAYANEVMRYTMSFSDQPRNELSGNYISTSIESGGVSKWLLMLPDLTQKRITLPYSEGMLQLTSTANSDIPDPIRSSRDIPMGSDVGHYGLSPLEQPGQLKAGWSVQLPSEETNLDPLTLAELDLRFGEGKYSLNRDLEELKRQVVYGRLGQEIYPLLITILLLVFVGEHLLANWFYKNQTAAE